MKSSVVATTTVLPKKRLEERVKKGTIFSFEKNSYTRGEEMVHKAHDVLKLTVTSNGRSGKEWIDRFRGKGIDISGDAVYMLRMHFTPTKNITNEVVILKDKLRGYLYGREKVLERARQNNLSIPNMETVCLVLDKLSIEELKGLGLIWLTVANKNAISIYNTNLLYNGQLEEVCHKNINSPEGGIIFTTVSN